MTDDTTSRRKFTTGAAALGAAALLMRSKDAAAATTVFPNDIEIGTLGFANPGCIFSDQTWGMLFRAKHQSPTYLFGWASGVGTWPGASMVMETNGALSPKGGVNSVAVFAALGSPTTANYAVMVDDTAALQAAIDSLGDPGGTIFLNAARKYRIDGTLTVKSGVTLAGYLERPTIRRDTLATLTDGRDLMNFGSQLVLGPTGTITLKASAGLKNLLILYSGITSLPRLMDNDTTVNGFSLSSTAVTLAGDGGFVKDCFIGGFWLAVHSTKQCAVLDGVWGDNYNGILLENSYDISRISNCHFMPWLTMPGSDAGQALRRVGRSNYSFQVASGCDWTRFHNCFSFGYFFGFLFTGGDATLLSQCGSDSYVDPGFPPYPGSAAYYIDTSVSNEIRLENCQGAAHTIGLYAQMKGGSKTMLHAHNCEFWANTIGFHSGSASSVGIARVTGCTMRGSTANGVYTAAAPSSVYLRDCTIHTSGTPVTLGANIAGPYNDLGGNLLMA